VRNVGWSIDSRWLRDNDAERRLLFVYAHPDDESFGNAGTILRYSSDGVAVHYACATRGEAGDVSPELLAGYADVGALRTVEQMRAAEVLGLTGVHFLGHRDSGMPGSPDNQHPNALIRQPPALVAGQIVALIRTIRPQVVVTFGPYGGYGHPDHVFCHRVTTAAFEAAGNPTLYPEQIADGLAPWQPQRLYYSTFGTRFLSTVVFMMRLLGKDPSRFGRNGDVDLVRAAREATPATTKSTRLHISSRRSGRGNATTARVAASAGSVACRHRSSAASVRSNALPASRRRGMGK